MKNKLVFSTFAILLILGNSSCEHKEKSKEVSFGKKEQYNLPIGAVKNCAINPVFPEEKGLTAPFLIDLRQQGYRGMRIIENKKDGKILTMPSWSKFGWLGLYTLDDKGNIYLSSIPHESILHNPVGKQNRILRVDQKTGIMEQFMDLPQSKPSTLKNPFGAIGLHYDCDNSLLYVSSIAGSSYNEELGRIYQIDLETKEVVGQLENIDVLGISSFNTASGKRLYFGLARKPEIYSIAIDQKGNFSGNPRFEISLLDQKGGAFDKAHRIRFRNNIMEIKANEFNYTLAAASNPEQNIYTFHYEKESDKWIFIDVYQK